MHATQFSEFFTLFRIESVRFSISSSSHHNRCRLRHPRRRQRGRRRRRPRTQDQYNDHKVFRLNFNVLRVLVKCNEYSCSSYRCVALRMQWKEQNRTEPEIALQVAPSHSLWSRVVEGFKSSVHIQTPTFGKSEKHRTVCTLQLHRKTHKPSVKRIVSNR